MEIRMNIDHLVLQKVWLHRTQWDTGNEMFVLLVVSTGENSTTFSRLLMVFSIQCFVSLMLFFT